MFYPLLYKLLPKDSLLLVTYPFLRTSNRKKAEPTNKNTKNMVGKDT